ncbi:Glyoxalase/bleomycin resistance protein/dioxygenase [Gloeothece citriformis PCC 7424]|uniref:Glyoxalase/bleomycin resistance protein/dioxygenase n=1 Tax=Gloeothece citriformis (strain PCC 7424) TaxID=65393 RepID=B7KAV0_GLOC7|nr:VOC family protein [Gloeothece citriformis]ACK68772.1 Glyoxalase/bleomycin resistance protein/dioxygenase [Gloeothece citriformis PCC 7424]
MLRPPIEQQITFIYTRNFTRSTQFYEEILKLTLWLDQGSCRIYQVTQDGYIGICQGNEPKNPLPGQQNNLILTLVTQQVDQWYSYLQQEGINLENPPSFNEKYQIYHFFFRDPDGYLIEIQRFGN